MPSLFRAEALAARQQPFLGAVQLARPLSLAWITAGVVAVAVAVAAFLTMAPYTRKATVGGVLVPDRGLIRLVPAAAGTVVERRVVEGQTVLEGDVLFVLALEQPTLGVEARAQVLRSVNERRRSLHAATRQQQALVAAQLQSLDVRLQALAGEIAQVDAEATLQQQRMGLARQALERLEALEASHFIAAAQVQTRREEVLGLQAAARTLARQRAALERERAELIGLRRSLPLQSDGTAGGIDRELALLTREEAEVDTDRRLVVRAPQSGTVSAVLAEPGQSVSPSSALASVVPAGAVLQAQLLAPSRSVGFVRPGQTVRLRFDAFPYQKYGHWTGTVMQVSRTPLAASELGALAMSGGLRAPGTLPAAGVMGGEPMFRITVALGPPGRGPIDAMAIVPVAGMRLEADILLETRRLVEWLFEPLIGLRGRLA